MWVTISLIGKVSDGYIKDLGFNPRPPSIPKTDWCFGLMIKSFY